MSIPIWSMSAMRCSAELPWARVRTPFWRLTAWLSSLACVSRYQRETSAWPSTSAAALSLRTWQWMSAVNHLPRACAGPGKRPGMYAPGGWQVNSIAGILGNGDRSDSIACFARLVSNRGRAMRRRELLKTGIATAAALAMPRLAGAARANTLVFVPTSDLAVLDPIVTFNRPTRNYAYLVFDTLYGIDTNWQAQPQMVAGHEVEDDGLTWQLRLREGLRFHDNEPVLARDVVASIRRFAPRIGFATALMAATEELSASDDRTVRFRLKRPFPHLPAALAGPGGTVPAIMPERLATTSPYQPVKEILGSGPYRFLADEHVSGARAAFGRFAEYRPRDSGALGFTSGPKVVHFDRVEWVTLDPFSAQGALGNGEIDWWESPARDLYAQVARDTNVTAVSHYMPAMGILRFNQLYPPFDNPAMRRALLPAIDQKEAMIAIAGEDPTDRYDEIG